MKTFYLTCFLILCHSSIVRADDFTINTVSGWSNNIDFQSDYVERGISQTEGRPAIDVGIAYQDRTGIFGGFDVTNTRQGNGNVETDLTLGYATSLSSSWLYQNTVIYTGYPGSSNNGNLDTVEFQNILNWKQTWGTLIGAFAFQPQGQNHGGFYTYTEGGVDFTLRHDFILGTRVGYSSYANHAAHPNYLDWTVSLSKRVTRRLAVSVQYTGSTNYNHITDPGNGQHVILVVSLSLF